jgi:hypothetical protein
MLPRSLSLAIFAAIAALLVVDQASAAHALAIGPDNLMWLGMAGAAGGGRVTHKQYRLQRKIASVPIVAGSFSLTDLPRAYDYESLFLRISASIQISVAVVTSIRAESPTQVVPRIEVIADGKNTLYSAPFWYASLGNYTRDLLQSGARVTTPQSAVAVATYAVEAIGVVDFATQDGARPKDSNFRTSALSLFQLRLTYGQAVDTVVVGAATVAFSGSPVVDVFSSEMVELPAADGSYANPIALKKVSYQQLAVPASNTALKLNLPAGNLIKSVFYRAEGIVTAGEPSAAAFNNFILESGVDVRLNLAAASLRAKNNADFGQLTAGYYVGDVTALGKSATKLSDLWDVTGQAQPDTTMDVTGGANVNIQIVVTEYILARAG